LKLVKGFFLSFFWEGLHISLELFNAKRMNLLAQDLKLLFKFFLAFSSLIQLFLVIFGEASATPNRGL
jgi:hypothetical protein